MKLRYLFLMNVMWLFCMQVVGQDIVCPEIAWTTPDPLSLGCEEIDTCFSLEARLPDIRATIDGANAYTVNEIPFNDVAPYWPIPANATEVLVNIDDVFSNVINLPFTFCFYGTTYDKIIVGANGRISFDVNLAGDFDPWSFNASIPSSLTPFKRACIYGPYHDIDPSVYSSEKSIHWQVIDQAPCRKMVITYSDVPHYNCNNLKSSFQIVLYENTNIIEVHVRDKPVCYTWNGGRAIIGIQNWSQTQATTVAGMNYGITHLTNVSYRFTPNGPSLISGSIELLDENLNILQAIPSPPAVNGLINVSFDNICLDSNSLPEQNYTVRAVYTACSGQDIVVEDVITVIKPGIAPPPDVTSPIVYCLGDSPNPLQATALPGYTLNWYDENQDPLPSVPTPDISFSGDQTFYVAQHHQNCESNLVPILVQVNQPDTVYISEEICNSALPFLFNGQNIFTGGIYYHTEPQAFGCDSTTILTLEVHNVSIQNHNISVCETDLPFIWHGIIYDETYNPGVYSEIVTYSSVNGCDSMHKLNLSILPIFQKEEVRTICEYDLPYVWHGITWDQGWSTGSYNDVVNYISSNGCDSIINLTLNINPAFEEIDTLVLCENELPFTWRGINIPTGTVNQTSFSAVYQTLNSCDSIIYLDLTINPIYETTIEQGICSSDLPFTWNQHELGVQTLSGIYHLTSSNISIDGCDSVTNLILEVHEEYELIRDTAVCSQDLPFVLNGTIIDESNVGSLLELNYINSNGCDSTIFLTVNLYEGPEYVSILETSCNEVFFEGVIYDHSTTFTDTFYNYLGCDSLIRDINIVVYPEYSEYNFIELSGCDSVMVNGDVYYGSTDFLETFLTVNGCDSLTNKYLIRVYEFQLHLTSSKDTLFSNELVQLETYSNQAYNVMFWSPAYLFLNPSLHTQLIAIDDHVLIEVAAESLNGCKDTASIALYFLELDKNVFVPNAFSPNGDGLNDEFGPEIPMNVGYKIEEFSVYNRYGQRIFYNSGQYNKKWDGTYKEVPSDVGVYFWILKVSYIDGTSYDAKGEVHLIR